MNNYRFILRLYQVQMDENNKPIDGTARMIDYESETGVEEEVFINDAKEKLELMIRRLYQKEETNEEKKQ